MTSGDVAIPMRVIRTGGEDGLADCVSEDGETAAPRPCAPRRRRPGTPSSSTRAWRSRSWRRPREYVDEYRDAELGRALSTEIEAIVEPGRHYKVMEVCGGHTHAIYKYGIDDLLPENVELVHGPGCPVCVIPMGRVDDGIALAREPGVIFTCFGDMLRVPGSSETLMDAKAGGADVRMVYSPLDALRIARQNPDRQVVFFAIGFETTAPSTALTLKRAKAEGIANFSVMCSHVTIVPPLKALLESPDLRLDGFVGPGHVATIVGARPFEFIPADYGRPVVISGFEPLDVLQSILWILRQLAAGECKVENQYKRVVPAGGQPARARGALGGLRAAPALRVARARVHLAVGPGDLEAYADLDAERRFTVPGVRVADPKACQCGEVLKGVIKPWECKVFGTACTPEHAIGTCMVSPEGACAAYYNYGRFAQGAGRCLTSGSAAPRWGGSSGSSGSSRPPAPSGRASRTPRSRWPTAPAARPPGR